MAFWELMCGVIAGFIGMDCVIGHFYLSRGYMMPFWNDVVYELLRQMVREKQLSQHLGTCYEAEIFIRFISGKSWRHIFHENTYMYQPCKNPRLFAPSI